MEPPVIRVQSLERVRHVLDATVMSRDGEREYYPRIVLSAVMLCTCTGSQARDSKCVHLKAILESLDDEELRQFILDSQVIPR